MQTASYRIWTLVTNSISYDDNSSDKKKTPPQNLVCVHFV